MQEKLAVRARGVSKSFGEVVALDGVDLDIAQGQVHGLVGPNGAGKTTLLGLLLGLAEADGGDLQILGAQPLNEKLAAATPMYGAFTNKPDYTPFDVKPNRVPLTQGVATPPACGVDTLGRTGAAATALRKAQAQAVAVPAEQEATAAAWETWIAKQRLAGPGARADLANPEQMNRYTWYESHEWKVPYPGDSEIYAPSEVPGAYIPNPDPD